MEEENKFTKKLLKLLLFIFTCFLIMYLSKETGFYEFKAHQKSTLTKEAMMEFENDIKDGKNVSLKDYVVGEYVDYSNVVSKTGSKVNSIVEGFMNTGIKKSIKVLKHLFYD